MKPHRLAHWVSACAALWAASSTAGSDTASSAQRELEMMDADRNGTVSMSEHSTGARQMFERMDANRDGKVTALEMDTTHRALTGRPPGLEEMTSSRKISVIDTDQDGVLSATEHATGSARMFDTMDTNDDRELTAQELQSGHERMMGRQKY
jgi:hypothetical protein